MPPRLPIHLELKDLRLVATIAESGSLTAATRSLHLTQSTVSYRVAKLERRLGFPLLHRKGRGITLTAEARQLIATGAELLRSAESLEEWVREVRGTPRRTVRVAAECYTTFSWLPAAIRGLRRQWPDAAVIPTTDWTRDPVAGVREDAVDLAIVAESANIPDLDSEPLWQDRFVLLVAPDHALSHRRWVTPSVLAEEHLVVYEARPKHSWVVGRILGAAGVAPRRLTEVPLTEGILAMVEAGSATAVLARWAVDDAIRAGRVVAIEIRSPHQTRQWHAVYRRTGPVHDMARAMVRLLQQHGE